MGYLEKLKLYLPMVGTTKNYKGYWFKIYDCLVILVCVCLCGLGNLKQIHRYAKNRVTNMKKYAQPVHIISAHVYEFGITIGQLSVKSKNNEIPLYKI